MYKLNITLSDQDYLDFNLFLHLQSSYGKKQMRTIRITYILVFIFFILNIGMIKRFTPDTLLYVIVLLLTLLIIQILLKSSLKKNITKKVNQLLKTNKALYSSTSIMEFYDDYFSEITKDEKNEIKYTLIEQVSIVSNKMIYIHRNNVITFIIPFSSFTSNEELNSFLEFIKTKFNNVTTY